jgi:hypothetical protein
MHEGNNMGIMTTLKKPTLERRRHHHLPPHVGQSGAMSPALAVGAGPPLVGRSRSAVIPAVDLATRRIAMAARGPQPHTCGCRGGNAALEGGHATGVEGIEGAPARVIMEMAGLHAGGNEARERLRLKKMGAKGALLVDNAAAGEPQGCDRMAGGHHTPCRVGLRRGIHPRRAAECCEHSRNETQVISDLGTVCWRLWREGRAIRVSPSLLLGRGMVAAPKNYSMTRAWCGIAA